MSMVDIDSIRRRAVQHLKCKKISLDLFDDGCICLLCDDCDVIIENFGSCKFSEIATVLLPTMEIKVRQSNHEEKTEIEVISDFGNKFYEQPDFEKEPEEEEQDDRLFASEPPVEQPEPTYSIAQQRNIERRQSETAILGVWDSQDTNKYRSFKLRGTSKPNHRFNLIDLAEPTPPTPSSQDSDSGDDPGNEPYNDPDGFANTDSILETDPR